MAVRAWSWATLLLSAISLHNPSAAALADDSYHPRNSRMRTAQWHTDTPKAEKETSFWLRQAQEELKLRLQRTAAVQQGPAKNVIFFLGDGLSTTTLTAARLLRGQRQGQPGEESRLALEDLPYAGFSKTYCVDAQTPDSACTATAYLSGVKTNIGVIGLNAHASNCADSANVDYQVTPLTLWAQRAGKATGIVTTTRVTHASPAAAYAHVAAREWESDADIADTSGGCMDIAKQLVSLAPGCDFDVILGGGMREFVPQGESDSFGNAGRRRDGSNLVRQWQQANPNGTFVSSLQALRSLNASHVGGRVFGMFSSTHLAYHMDAQHSRAQQPRLKDMTEAALRRLAQHEKGFFVFIEGGRIDHGHHDTRAGYALDETLEFDEAIRTALALTNASETLLIVTSDHSHTMSMSGYPRRGTPILRLDEANLDRNGVPYGTLNYALGRQQYLDEHGSRYNPRDYLTDTSYTPSYIPALMGTHAGEDVGIFASGPQAQLFSGVMQQNLIPHLIKYAACLGDGTTHCREELFSS